MKTRFCLMISLALLPLASWAAPFGAKQKLSTVIVFQDADVPYFESQHKSDRVELRIVRQNPQQTSSNIDSPGKESSSRRR